MTWATMLDVQARIPSRSITATSLPSDAQVEAWIDEAEASLRGTLISAGLLGSYEGADALKVLRSWVCDFAEGRTRQAYASAGGDGSNDDGKDLVERFEQRLDDIYANPGRYGSMLAAGPAPTSALHVRGQSDTTDPLFVMGEEQF